MTINNFLKNRCAIAIAHFLFLFAVQLSAQPSIRLFGTTSRPKMNSALSVNATYLSVDHQALSSVLVIPHFILQGIPIPEMAGVPKSVDLDLNEFSVLTDKTTITLIDGNKRIPGSMPTVKSYRGSVKGMPHTLACISCRPDGHVSGFIRFDGIETFAIETASKTDTYTSFIVALSAIPAYSDMTRCDVTDDPQFYPNGRISPHPQISGKPQKLKPLAALKTCVIAYDIDYQCYQDFGSDEAAATDYLTTLLAAITTVYEKEINVAISLGPLQVFTTPDPYNGGDMGTLLNSFSDYWVSHNSSVDRTLAHLMTRKLGGSGAEGIASVLVMCDKDRGYALTNISGVYTSVDEAVMCHEIGHNVGSQHTHNCDAYPPSGIDHCSAREGSCPSWSIVQSVGCIMSYCNNKQFTFHTVQGDDRVVTTLQDAVDQATCLASLAMITVNDTAITFPKTNFKASKDSLVKKIITSSGTEADLKISSVSIEGTDAGSFTVKSPPKFPVTLTNGQGLDLTITFKPQYGGDLNAQLRIAHNATGGSSIINLYGRGAVPIATFLRDGDLLDFGPITDHLPHDSTLIYVQNDGDGPLSVDSTFFSLGTSKEFSIFSGHAPVIVPPGKQGQIVIRFQAKSNATKQGIIYFRTNDPNQFDRSSVNLSAEVSGLSVASSPANVLQLLISPNPFSGKLQMELRADAEYFGEMLSVNIFDNLGRKVGSIGGGKLSSTSEKLSWQPDASLAQGTYTVVAKIGTQEIVKQIVYIK